MNDADNTYWTAYARTLADQIGLKDWDIKITRWGPDAPNAAAAMATVSGRKIVHIKLGDSFHTDDAETKRHYILHELIHVYTDDADTVVWQAGEVIDSPAFTLMRSIYKDRIEFAVDGLAKAVGHAFPLPPERTADSNA